MQQLTSQIIQLGMRIIEQLLSIQGKYDKITCWNQCFC